MEGSESRDMTAAFRECIRNLGELGELDFLQGRREDSRRLEGRSKRCCRIREDKVGSDRVEAGQRQTHLCPS